MSIKEKLLTATKDAMKAGDVLKRTTLRMALAAIKNLEIETREELGDPAALALLQKEVKSRREAIADAKTAGRDDLIEQAEAEILILEAFLPQPLTEEELRAIVQEAIAETGASSPREMGNVMKALMPRVQGRADGKTVSGIVRDLLQG